MTTRMLIDARHQEETRVAVLKGNRIEEFDFESADHKQIKGNIYLAKVTRVEPSLQAAFVDYGGNRHGFLAFSEIHPDYYQIPREDREALLAEEARHAEEEAALRDEEEEDEDRDVSSDDYDDDLDNDSEDDNGNEESDSSAFAEQLAEESGVVDGDEDPIEAENLSVTSSSEDENSADSDDDIENGDNKRGGPRRRGRKGARAKGSDEARKKRMALRRRYKIQDVIHRRQVLLVQVVKEERGNKGAALTTYLSLAGRYCVLMPNSSHGGGISRKISNSGDRKRLKTIIADLNLPATMGCIVRTAGLSRTKTEIKRDFDYLARLWDEIREKTLSASAPENIHSDSDLIKRAIRDIYNRDIEEVLVEGEGGYRAAKDFMKLLMPSHARRVKSYSDPVSLFQRYGAEDQLSAMYEPVVQLKSGGYLVINPTEALVSIDINSGRSTKEHGIEATAVSTNLEAAREIARQLRLRDMAGLVVIDFIDMDYGSNVRKVERAMRDALKSDRARIQVGRISGFGLMEMSRQRLRTGVLEASTRTCPHCDGTGLVRTASSAGLSALRMLEEESAKGRGSIITLRTSQEATIYVLNNKRSDIAAIEDRYGVFVEILPNGENEGAKMEVSSSGPKPEKTVNFAPIIDDDDDDYDDLPEDAEDEREDNRGRNERNTDGEDGEGRNKRRRRRRGKRNRGDRGAENSGNDGENVSEASQSSDDADTGSQAEGEKADDAETTDGEAKPKRARRGRRGGRRSRNASDNAEQTQSEDATSEVLAAQTDSEEAPSSESQEAGKSKGDDDVKAEEKPKRRRSRAKKPDVESAKPDDAVETEAAVAEAPEKPKRNPRRKAAAKPAAETTEAKAAPEAEADEAKPAKSAVKAPAKRRAPAKRKSAQTAETADKTADAPIAETKPAEATPTPKAVAKPANDDKAEARGPGRKGWWQRTFGN